MGILEIIALVAELAPKVATSFGAVADLYRTAAGILSDANANGGAVDPDAEMRLRAIVAAELKRLDDRAAEAGQA